MNKYLLYFDILGFTNYVYQDPNKIREIYTILDSLNVHSHHVFETIVFSDTILVYNKMDPITDRDHEYLVMYACEFIQDFLYRTIGREIYYRAILKYGEFEHYKLENIQCFYGKSLIEAYYSEKEINSMGLFIDKDLNKYNKIFKTTKYNENYSFVYLNQSLESLLFYSIGGNLPITAEVFEDDANNLLPKDVKLLENIYQNIATQTDPKVKGKYQSLWDMYDRRYHKIMDHLVAGKFKLEVICSDYDWSKH